MQGYSASSSNAGYYAASESLESEMFPAGQQGAKDWLDKGLAQKLEEVAEQAFTGLSDISVLQELRHAPAYENGSCCTTGDLGALDELAALTSDSSNFFVSVLGAEPFVPESYSPEGESP